MCIVLGLPVLYDTDQPHNLDHSADHILTLSKFSGRLKLISDTTKDWNFGIAESVFVLMWSQLILRWL